jgi:hypothetical protein
VLGAGHGKAGVWGDTGGASGGGYYGVLGTADNNSAGGFYNNGAATTLIVGNSAPYMGYSGDALDATANGFEAFAVRGVNPNFIGVTGNTGTISATGQSNEYPAGVWGDTSTNIGFSFGVIGTADDNTAGLFANNSDRDTTLEVFNGGTGGLGAAVLVAAGPSGVCSMNTRGDMGCTGKVITTADVEGGARKVALYSVQSPENWFEDFGSAALSNGAATVALDATFAQTVNSGIAYHVFLTANGDCKGLYVTQKSPTSFEVREMGGGTSSVAFDYRIVAKRAGFESVRLADVTAQIKRQAIPIGKARRSAQPTIAPKSTTGKPVARLGTATPASTRPVPH